MNARVCKSLRALARANTVGEPYEVYRIKPGYPAGRSLVPPIEVHPSCTKGVYRHLKKLARKGR